MIKENLEKLGCKMENENKDCEFLDRTNSKSDWYETGMCKINQDECGVVEKYRLQCGIRLENIDEKLKILLQEGYFEEPKTKKEIEENLK